VAFTKIRYPGGKDAAERGEGVISAAIAVLVMAFIGVAMWAAFSSMFHRTANNVDKQVSCIGQSTSNC
jgi:type II secretory pathway component PulK